MIAITLLTQEDCAHCQHAKTVLDRVGVDYPLSVEVLDLRTPQGDALARNAGAWFAPIVLVGGKPFSHGRLSERKLRRELDRQASPT